PTSRYSPLCLFSQISRHKTKACTSGCGGLRSMAWSPVKGDFEVYVCQPQTAGDSLRFRHRLGAFENRQAPGIVGLAHEPLDQRLGLRNQDVLRHRGNLPIVVEFLAAI